MGNFMKKSIFIITTSIFIVILINYLQYRDSISYLPSASDKLWYLHIPIFVITFLYLFTEIIYALSTKSQSSKKISTVYMTIIIIYFLYNLILILGDVKLYDGWDHYLRDKEHIITYVYLNIFSLVCLIQSIVLRLIISSKNSSKANDSIQN